MFLASIVRVGTTKPKYEVADVFRQYGDAYRRKYHLMWQQSKAMQAIVNCRTAALGGDIEKCDACGRFSICYCSCKNRSCPKCGAFEKAQWLTRQEVKLLPIPYFHVVFTTDHAINALARVNKWEIYNLLFRTAAKTLKVYGRKYLGGEIGFTTGLHTWGQDISEHVHLHCIVTGGALQQTGAGERWQPCAKGFLFPIVRLSADFRDRFCEGLLRLYRRGKLKLVGQAAGVDVEVLVKKMRSKKWEVFAKEAFDSPEYVYDYLGKYTHRIAISNYRIVSISRGRVRFTYHDNKDGGREKVMALPALEFIRRFLLHVLPSRFVRIRHYGLHHSSKRGALERSRALLGLSADLPEPPELVMSEWVESFLGQDPRLCPFCEQGRMFRYRDFEPVSPTKSVILSVLGIPIRGQVVG